MEQTSSSSVCDTLPPLSSKYPWLISQNLEAGEHNTEDQLFCTIHNELPHYRCRIPELLGKRISGCFHGWVILSSHPHNVNWSLWNPMTSMIISLPTLTLKDGNYKSIGECCLSAPPDDPSSIFLLTRTNKSKFLFCRVNGERKMFSWTEMSYAKRLKKLTKDGDLVHSLTCCNGKVYALSTDGHLSSFILNLDIVVTDEKVQIKLMMFGAHPHPSSNHWGVNASHYHVNTVKYLIGSSSDLFYIKISFKKDTKNAPSIVNIFKSDMTCVNWEERECLKHWDLTDFTFEGVKWADLTDWHLSSKTWEEMDDVKDKIFFVDLAHDRVVFSSCVIASELGGYVHIRSELGDTISSYMSRVILSPCFLYLLQCCQQAMRQSGNADKMQRLEDDNVEAKYLDDSKVEMENNVEVLLRSGTDDGVENSESHLLNVPFHVLETILGHLVGVEYMNFRATCKKCHLAAPLRNWSSKTSLRRLQTKSVISPWLMVIGKSGFFTFIDPILGNKYFMKKSLQVSKVAKNEFNQLFCSRFGWLLFQSYDDFRCLVLFNPFTSDLRKLPDGNIYWESVCFSAPPTSPDCMVVGFSTRDWHAHIHFVNQEPTWRTLYLGPDPHKMCFLSFCGQNLCGLSKEGEIIVFNNLAKRAVNKKKKKGKRGYSWKLLEAASPQSCCRSSTQSFLAENDQRLYLVRVCDFGKHVEVFKLNDSKQEWEKIDSLGKHAIYICGPSCLCIKSIMPQLQNKIFFPHLHTKSWKMVYYSLDTCMYHTFDDKNQENLRDFVGATFLLSPYVWIEPSWF